MEDWQVVSLFLQSYPGQIRVNGYSFWYKCAMCGKACARQGAVREKIPKENRMKIVRVQGTTNISWNLRPLCLACSKKFPRSRVWTPLFD